MDQLINLFILECRHFRMKQVGNCCCHSNIAFGESFEGPSQKMKGEHQVQAILASMALGFEFLHFFDLVRLMLLD